MAITFSVIYRIRNYGSVSDLLEVLSLVALLSKLWKSHVKELQQNNGWEAGRGLVHGLI